jgi:myo-inositol-1-phosphate synthase
MSQRVGLWLVGARGGVSTVAALGLAALKRGIIDSRGLVTGLPAFSGLGLVDWQQIVVGGHEIRNASLIQQAASFQQSSRAFPPELLEQVSDELVAVDQRIQPGILHHSGHAIEHLAEPEILSDNRPLEEKLDKLEQDLIRFREEQGLARVVVVNVASTEPQPAGASLPASWRQAISRLGDFPVSTLYAVAAMKTGCSYVNFTPSLGSDTPALHELAEQSSVVHAGRDGKTGETLIKSALAPAFAMRHLEVLSWVGHNIFGNLDGQVLDDPENKQTKVKSKDQLLTQMLGYRPQTHISIEYIKSLGDWKTAWDHIHFRGFLGTPMVMQFTWQGCDSILAAPLVLDLTRLAERAMRAGQQGVLPWLACFFKSPMGVEENCLVRQFALLESWASEMASQQPTAPRTS